MNYSLRDVTDGVCTRFGITLGELRGEPRHREIARPRQIAMYLAREMTARSLPSIGAYLCRDHTTILYGARKVGELIQSDAFVRQAVEECRTIIALNGSSYERIRQRVSAGAGRDAAPGSAPAPTPIRAA